MSDLRRSSNPFEPIITNLDRVLFSLYKSHTFPYLFDRCGADLCSEEQSFLVARRRRIRKHFAEFIGVDEQQVHEEDVPIIGIAAR